MASWLSLTLICHLLWWSAAFLPPRSWSKENPTSSRAAAGQHRRGRSTTILAPSFSWSSSLSAEDDRHADEGPEHAKTTATAASAADQRNAVYTESLLDNLTRLLDKYILTGSSATKDGIYNLLQQIESHARDPDAGVRARRRIQRAGLPVPSDNQQPPPSVDRNPKELGRTDDERRRQEAELRRQWESTRTSGEAVASSVTRDAGRSALSRRSTLNDKPDLFLGQVDRGLSAQQKLASDKVALQKQLLNEDGKKQQSGASSDDEQVAAASTKVSELVAKAGAASAFEGQALGIGGLDDVLAQVKRRVWTPLAAPPQLLGELGITPVRGLLLYGKPGCGKTLLARKLGQLLSPLRYVPIGGRGALGKSGRRILPWLCIIVIRIRLTSILFSLFRHSPKAQLLL